MEAHIKLAKPQFVVADPLACLFSRSPDALASAERELLLLFEHNKFLLEKYTSIKTLWSRLMAVRVSRCGNYLVALVDDNSVLLFDIRRSFVYAASMPILENVLPCAVDVSGRTVVVGGVGQVLVLHTDSGLLSGADFTIPGKIKQIACEVSQEEQRRAANLIHPLDKIVRTDYTGDYHEIVTPQGTEVRGLVGVLFTKGQYVAMERLQREEGERDDDEEGGDPTENDAARYILLLISVMHSVPESCTVVKQKTLNVEFSSGATTQGARESCLMIRSDSECNMNVVALNSAHKYYCQLIILPSHSLTGTHVRPINFISADDVLPTDKYGRTSMLISDIAWSPNNAFVVVSFCSNYFCVLSRLGQPLNMLCPAGLGHSLQHFYVFESETPGEKLEDNSYPHITLSDVSFS